MITSYDRWEVYRGMRQICVSEKEDCKRLYFTSGEQRKDVCLAGWLLGKFIASREITIS